MEKMVTLNVDVIIRLLSSRLELSATRLEASFKMRQGWRDLHMVIGVLDFLSVVAPEVSDLLADVLQQAVDLRERYTAAAPSAAGESNGSVERTKPSPAVVLSKRLPHTNIDGRSSWMRSQRTSFGFASKLTETEILEIFDLAWSPPPIGKGVNQYMEEIAKTYNVVANTVYSIKARRTWKQLLDEKRPSGPLQPEHPSTSTEPPQP